VAPGLRHVGGPVRAALGDRILAIQHLGSTAVPGLVATPVIDIDLAVADPADEAAFAPALEQLGLVHWLTEPDWHQHRLFKHLGEPRVHLLRPRLPRDGATHAVPRLAGRAPRGPEAVRRR
jgi:GrpB-like predicted nucleotidyltransferase (UPF0157 family)